MKESAGTRKPTGWQCLYITDTPIVFYTLKYRLPYTAKALAVYEARMVGEGKK